MGVFMTGSVVYFHLINNKRSSVLIPASGSTAHARLAKKQAKKAGNVLFYSAGIKQPLAGTAAVPKVERLINRIRLASFSI